MFTALQEFMRKEERTTSIICTIKEIGKRSIKGAKRSRKKEIIKFRANITPQTMQKIYEIKIWILEKIKNRLINL